MKRSIINTLAAALVLAVSQSTVFAHGGHGEKLHVNPKWKECSFQLDPSLTQSAWHQFTGEAGLVTFFRPLADAAPMGAGNFEFSLLQWQTGIDAGTDAWNNTFVHPDSTHWLAEESGLKFPGLMFRAGITGKIDLGAYFTKNPGANYGFYGGQVQYNFVNDTKNNWAASARASFVSLYGPKDLDVTVYGLEVLASRNYPVWSKRVSVSPYAGVSTYLSRSHEKTAAVDLKDEKVLGVRATAGAVAQISIARVGVEYSIAKVNSLSIKMGVSF